MNLLNLLILVHKVFVFLLFRSKVALITTCMISIHIQILVSLLLLYLLSVEILKVIVVVSLNHLFQALWLYISQIMFNNHRQVFDSSFAKYLSFQSMY